jgi:hypothetical protein
MVALFLKSTNAPLGDISEADFQFLRDNLEEESVTDNDYTMDRMTLEYLRGNGMSAALAQLFEQALGLGEEVEVRFEKK